ncbi:MAG: flagellar protein FlgN [Paraglaciecola sp.]|uniref:flagellar export chaperone FlgN n=1 Tax=Alteromonadaceae TaxID=72275 RepID=UPI00273F794C|nr:MULTISPECIES: flagellar export chaperone FlgN [Alteromonadaceae]MDP4944217.1 flagellar protein FlgN [Alishewanella sp.]MDP5028865.1 flagellar protein FlgN [Paraglaciecola sp.]MDP5036761.1 flagellar protein FlgN [Alishewanella sp.]MDP5129736.1 flagellar protein FlgN [Paraglaciecola sp.]MDP5459909.1 flagellar export chaperone FlgN [Alishewanella sp. SMS8]
MNTAQSATLTCLNQQQAHLSALLLLLEHELKAVTERDVPRLNNIIEQKNTLLLQIEQTDKALSQSEDLAEQRKQSWFDERIAVLDDLLAQCKQQTAVNQQVLEHSQLTLGRLKHEILSANGKTGLTYTNKGKPAVDSKGSGVKA